MLKKRLVENDNRRFESVYTSKVRAGRRRTYFFDVRQTKGDDYYITITESTKRFNGDGYERHKIFLYKEDFNRFLGSLEETVDHIKSKLMPDYDYDEFTRKQEEWEKQQAEQAAAENSGSSEETPAEPAVENTEEKSDDSADDNTEADESDSGSAEVTSEDDMSW